MVDSLTFSTNSFDFHGPLIHYRSIMCHGLLSNVVMIKITMTILHFTQYNIFIWCATPQELSYLNTLQPCHVYDFTQTHTQWRGDGIKKKIYSKILSE